MPDDLNIERDGAIAGESRNIYEAVFREMGDAVSLIDVEQSDEDYTFIYRRNNASHQEHSGLSEDELRGQTPQELLDDEQGTVVAEKYQECVERQETIEYEEKLELPGGTSVWQTKLTPITDSGQVTQIVSVARDITEQKERERQLKRIHQRFETVMETMSAAVFLKGADGEYLVMNQVCRELFNVEAPAITGLTDDDILPPDVVEKARKDDRRVIENGEVVETEETVPTAAGNTVRLTRKSPVYDDDEVVALCGVSTDITEQKRREQELQRLKDQFELAVEGADLGVWDWDMTTDEVEFNEQWAEMLGYSREELEFSFDTWERLVHPDDLSSVTNALEEHIEDDTDLYSHEIQMQTKEEDWKWILTAGRVVDRNDEGAATRAAGVHIDINDRKQAEKEIERTSQFLQETQEVANIGGWEVDLRSETMRWSDEVYRIHGLPLDANPTPEEGIEFYHPDDRDTIREAFDRLTTEGEPYNLELRIVTADDDVRWVRTRGEPRYEDDEIVAVQGTFQDITERKEREQELQQQNSRLDEFASVISHDLRNPLNVAQSRATILQQRADEELQKHLTPLVTALDRMEDIIEDTLTLARQGETVGKMNSIPVVDLIGKCWAGVETGEATLEIEDEFTLRGNRDRLRHVFENLFRNAVEHGGEDVTVRVGRCGENCLYVEDDGPGIPPSDRDAVLEPGHTSATGGTGFGLTIVNRIAEAHGWKVAITDGRDGGARFEFDTAGLPDE